MSQKNDALIAMLPPPPDLTGWISRTERHAAAVRSIHPTHFLVVGLASLSAFSIAAAHPEAEVVGLDEDPTHVDLLAETSRELDLDNLSLVSAALDDPANLSGPFDWIHVPDPPQPTDDEEGAWRPLAHRLASDGLLTLRMRSHRQEYWGDEFREALAILAGSDAPPDLDTWMAFGRRLAGDLSRGATRLRPVARRLETQLLHTPALAAALALLPAGRSHTPDSAHTMLARAGLVLLGFLNQSDWEPRGILADPEMETLEEGLRPEERYEMADILRAPDFLLVCGPQRDPEWCLSHRTRRSGCLRAETEEPSL